MCDHVLLFEYLFLIPNKTWGIKRFSFFIHYTAAGIVRVVYWLYLQLLLYIRFWCLQFSACLPLASALLTWKCKTNIYNQSWHTDTQTRRQLSWEAEEKYLQSTGKWKESCQGSFLEVRDFWISPDNTIDKTIPHATRPHKNRSFIMAQFVGTDNGLLPFKDYFSQHSRTRYY